MSAKTIFLSHSSKDLDRVRKIRDILEALEYDPLLFHLKCLDDDNDTLEDFIQKEIDARNIFVYCKSKHAELSVWVQKEVSYILNTPEKRLYVIDIERPLSETLVSLLHTLAEILKKNRVFISCSHADKSLSYAVSAILEKYGYDVLRYDYYDHNDTSRHEEDIERISQNGIFLPIITPNFLNSPYCMSEIEKVLYCSDIRDVAYKPVFANIPQSIAERLMPSSALRYNGYSLTSSIDVAGLLKFIAEDNKLY